MTPGVTWVERPVTGNGWTQGLPSPGGTCRVHGGVGIFCQPRFIKAVSTFTERTCVSTTYTEKTAVSTTYTERSV